MGYVCECVHNVQLCYFNGLLGTADCAIGRCTSVYSTMVRQRELFCPIGWCHKPVSFMSGLAIDGCDIMQWFLVLLSCLLDCAH